MTSFRVESAPSGTLPYDMGNAGDLLKHGVLAEFVRWQSDLGRSFRFFDLFGGEPESPAKEEVARRVRALPGGALRGAQTRIAEGRYFGSGLVARNAAASAGRGSIRVFTADRDPGRRERLQRAGLSMLHEEIPACGVVEGQYDGYTAFGQIVDVMHDDDLVLLDPFEEFLLDEAPTVVPRMAEAAKRGAVLLFALNRAPGNAVGRRFDALLERHLPGAWRVTCPPLPADTGVGGESVFHAEVALAARPVLEHGTSPDVDVLRTRLTEYTKHLGRVLNLLQLRVVGG